MDINSTSANSRTSPTSSHAQAPSSTQQQAVPPAQAPGMGIRLPQSSILGAAVSSADILGPSATPPHWRPATALLDLPDALLHRLTSFLGTANTIPAPPNVARLRAACKDLHLRIPGQQPGRGFSTISQPVIQRMSPRRADSQDAAPRFPASSAQSNAQPVPGAAIEHTSALQASARAPNPELWVCWVRYLLSDSLCPGQAAANLITELVRIRLAPLGQCNREELAHALLEQAGKLSPEERAVLRDAYDNLLQLVPYTEEGPSIDAVLLIPSLVDALLGLEHVSALAQIDDRALAAIAALHDGLRQAPDAPALSAAPEPTGKPATLPDLSARSAMLNLLANAGPRFSLVFPSDVLGMLYEIVLSVSEDVAWGSAALDDELQRAIGLQKLTPRQKNALGDAADACIFNPCLIGDSDDAVDLCLLVVRIGTLLQ